MTAKILQVRVLATVAHAGQMYGDLPYMAHVDEATAIVRKAGFGYGHIVTTLLHDTLEDTMLTPELLEQFGLQPEVIIGVQLATDEHGETRKARKAATYAKVERMKVTRGHMEILGVELGLVAKWGDRLANIRSATRGGAKTKGLLKMYQKEAATFRAVYMPTGIVASLATAPAFKRLLAEYDTLMGSDSISGQ